jgi:CheY-like chemotaxis protein
MLVKAALINELLRIMTSGEGYEVLSADSPHQALKIVQHNSPVDLALTDLEMKCRVRQSDTSASRRV